MDAINLTEVFAAVTKGGPAGILLALFFGLAMLVREVRGGKVGQTEKANLAAEVAALKSQVATLVSGMERMEEELERALDLVHSMRYQRDQARIKVEYLEQLHDTQPRTVWPPEPGVGLVLMAAPSPAPAAPAEEIR